MQTPWGDCEVWDAHVHFFSRSFFQTLASQSGRSLDEIASALGWQIPLEDSADSRLADQWTREMDRYGVAGAAIVASSHGDEASVMTAVEQAPRRFRGYFMLNPLAPDAVERTRKAFESGRAHGVCLFPAMNSYSIQDERVAAVLKVVRSGMVVFVHCGVLTVGVRKRLGIPSPFDMRFSNPIDLHSIALRNPHLNFVVPHFGAGYLRETLMLADLCPNVYLDSSSSNGWVKYLSGGVDLREVFRRALDVAGAGKLLFGTDSSFFPRGWNHQIFEEQTRCLKDLGVGEVDARSILGGNFRRLLQIS